MEKGGCGGMEKGGCGEMEKGGCGGMEKGGCGGMKKGGCGGMGRMGVVGWEGHIATNCTVRHTYVTLSVSVLESPQTTSPMCVLCYAFCIPVNGRHIITQKGHAQLRVTCLPSP